MPQDNESSKDYLGMSDEDFLNINGPETAPADPDPAPVEKTEEEKAAEATAAEVAAAAATDADKDKTKVEGDPTDPAKTVDAGKVEDEPEPGSLAAAKAADAEKAKPAADPADDPAKGADKDKADKTAEGADKDKDKTADPVEDKPVDHAAFYKQVMTPFKANGRTIELKTPEEAIRLMQMGAGFGRKLQTLQPALKTLKMLEKADLLDESKLSFLIDINNKNPDAIKKLIKESGIDPLDLNIGDNVDYAPKDHAVSDKEMAFHTAVDDLKGNPAGLETLRIVNQTWDQESKTALWDQPGILAVIQSQRENGVYDQIAAEIDRQKTLGILPPNTPFLQAYKLAGDHLQANNGFKAPASTEQIRTQSVDTPQPQVIATRAAAPKAQVQNSDKAAAAASTRTSTTRKASTTVNPLEMADDVFLKQFEGRL